MTCDGQILGTAAYMSPEQAEGRGHWIDRRADVYSLGVVMFQLATGELPYRGNFEVQLSSKLLDDAPDPRKLNRFIPRDFATICLKCLERDANRRYRGAGAVAAELRRFLKGEPIHARPLSRFERLWRWMKRKPAMATAAALAALVMVAGPVAALVIDSQRRELDGRVKELDKLVIGQQQTTRDLRGENAGLQTELAAQREKFAGQDMVVLDEWRRVMIARVVDRHYAVAVAAVDSDELDLESRARIHLGLGMMLGEVSRSEDAVQHLLAARSALEGLAAQAPRAMRVSAALADCCEQLAELYRAAGDVEASQRAAAQALDIRKRLAEGRQGDAVQVDVLASHYYFPQVSGAFEAIPELSQRLIDDWPRDAARFYEAACRLTLKTPVLTTGATTSTRQP
jgi:serine/threonine-protein kinase